MNAIINQIQVWYCDICDKTTAIKTKPKHITCKSHKQKKAYGTVVKQYEFINPDIDELNFILNDTIEGCRKKYLQSFQYRCVYVIKLRNMENNEEVFLLVTLR